MSVYSVAKYFRVFLVSLSFLFFYLCSSSVFGSVSPSLTAWHDGNAKKRIMDFVENAAVTVPESDRVAVFDIDGTILVERPLTIQSLVNVSHLCDQATRAPELLKQTLFKMSCGYKVDWLHKNYATVQYEAFYGKTRSFYEKKTEHILGTLKHPVFKTSVLSLFYLPMLQLMDYLLQHEFQVLLVSGSEQGFIRVLYKLFAAKKFPYLGLYYLHLHHESLIGSKILLTKNEAGEQVRSRAFHRKVWNRGKTDILRKKLGNKRPILAFGNSEGDIELLESAARDLDGIKGLSMIVNHDDSEREFVYQDILLLEKAREHRWPIISMKKDFKTLFSNNATLLLPPH